MAKVLKDDLIIQFLESKKATCLLPLIEMVGNLDELVLKGPEQFASEIPKVIDTCHKKLSDNDHIFEDIWQTGTDEEIIKIGRERGMIREKRRIKKNEGVFLSRPNVHNLVNSLIELLTEARNHVTDAESQVYFMKCREDSIPQSANKIKLAINNTVKIEEAPVVTLPPISEVVEEVVEEVKEEVIEKVEDVVPNASEKIEISSGIEPRPFTPDQIRYSDKDSLVVKESIREYQNHITMDTDFDINLLMNDWKQKFESFDANFKKEYIMKSYNDFYTKNPIKSLEKAVADFAVWNHILPKFLLATSYFSK